MATVLIVEDNREIAYLYERVFGQYRTFISEDVPEAIGYLGNERPDLVIMDFHLPSGSGVDVLAYMRSRERLRDVPVLGVSADDLLKEEARRQGMDAFLAKPIELRELVTTAQKLLSSHKRLPSIQMQDALKEYANAYKQVYNRWPNGEWTGTQALIDGQPCDERWLRSETRRLNSLTYGGMNPRNCLMRLLDKVRKL